MTAVDKVEGSDPCVNRAISRCQQLLHSNQKFFETTLVVPAFDFARFDDVRFGGREKKMIDGLIKKKRLNAAAMQDNDRDARGSSR